MCRYGGSGDDGSAPSHSLANRARRMRLGGSSTIASRGRQRHDGACLLLGGATPEMTAGSQDNLLSWSRSDKRTRVSSVGPDLSGASHSRINWSFRAAPVRKRSCFRLLLSPNRSLTVAALMVCL